MLIVRNGVYKEVAEHKFNTIFKDRGYIEAKKGADKKPAKKGKG